MADRGFPRGASTVEGGRAPTYYLANFSCKLHENEEILYRGGRGGGKTRPSYPLLDLPMQNVLEISPCDNLITPSKFIKYMTLFRVLRKLTVMVNNRWCPLTYIVAVL